MNTQCRKRRRQLHEERRQASARDYAEAATKAALADLCLVKHTSAHYSLRCQYPYEARWLMDLYPSSQRIYAIARPPAWPHQPPKLAVPLNWTVLDVVDAAHVYESDTAIPRRASRTGKQRRHRNGSVE